MEFKTVTAKDVPDLAKLISHSKRNDWVKLATQAKQLPIADDPLNQKLLSIPVDSLRQIPARRNAIRQAFKRVGLGAKFYQIEESGKLSLFVAPVSKDSQGKAT